MSKNLIVLFTPGERGENDCMFQYVRGFLEKNEHGAHAPGSFHPVDRWLVIDTLAGTRLRVFDCTHIPAENLLLSEQEGIREGNAYTFLLSALVEKLQKGDDTIHPGVGTNRGWGTVIDPQWVLSSQRYLAVDSQDIENARGVLLETPYGQVIIPRSRFEEDDFCQRLPQPLTCRPGDVFSWKQIRLTLLAVLSPL